MIILEDISIDVVNLRHLMNLWISKFNENIKLIRLSKFEISTHLEYYAICIKLRITF